jgi:hypothetical protein
VEKTRYDMELMGSVAHCEMLYRTNLVAIVAGGYRLKFANITVLIYDDDEKNFVLELVFPSQAKAVRLRSDKIIVATCNQINEFSFPCPHSGCLLKRRDTTTCHGRQLLEKRGA